VPEIAVNAEDFDADPLLLNAQNGTLDLRTGALRDHDPKDLLTKIADCPYYPDARAEVWDQFLGALFPLEGSAGAADDEMIAFRQRAIGYTLTGSTREPAFFIAFGTGRNGKSTLFNAVAKVLGDYAQDTPTQTIMRKDRVGGLSNDVAALAGARMVTVGETESGMQLNVGFVKQATGQDRITARYLYREAFTFRPQMKFWLMTNNRSEVPECTKAIWARLKFIPFEADFSGREDREMGTKLDAAREAILAWAVEGCKAWHQVQLNEPEKVRAATQAYRDDQDALAEFFAEKCEQGAGHEVKARELYNAYQEWAPNQIRAMTEKEFSAQMQQRGFSKVKKSVMHYRGIRLAASDLRRNGIATLAARNFPREPWEATGTDDDIQF
jgi:putative DNA primase/helicase